jgi:hypothetical protein
MSVRRQPICLIVCAPSTYLLDFIKLEFIKVVRWVICAGDDVCSNPGTGT